MVCQTNAATSRISGHGFCSLILIIIGCACNSSSSKSKNATLDSAFSKIDSTVARWPYYYTPEDMKVLDMAFSKVKQPSMAYMGNKYFRKILYYKELSRGNNTSYDSALVYADSAITLLQNQSGDEIINILYVKALFSKADTYIKVKNYSEAIRNYTIGKLMLSPHTKDSSLEYMYYLNMANVLFAQGKYLQAAEFFHVKFIIAPNFQKDSHLAFGEVQENMDNTGECYFKAGLTDSASWYYNATLKFIDKYEAEFSPTNAVDLAMDRSVVYKNMADILCKQNDRVGAESLYLKSLEGSKTVTDVEFNGSLRLSLLSLFVATKQLKKAARMLGEIQLSIDTSEISTVTRDFYKLRFDYYISSGKLAAANQALLHSYNIRDSIEKRDRQFNSIDLRQDFENRERKIINDALKKDNEVKTNFLLTAIISASMAFIIITLILYNLRRKSGYARKLTLLNAEVNFKNTDLHQTLASLEQSHTENNRIMRIVAHDLKNPINAIRTLIYSLLKKEHNNGNKEVFELIETTCVDSIALINDLLNNKRTLSDIGKEFVDIGRLIEQCAELFQIKAEEKKQLFRLQVDHPVIMMNRQKMWRVISNILNNAIKFSPENTEITICLKRAGENVLLSVQDNGIGIPADLKDKILKVDPEKSRPGTAGERSYGLGLSISQQIIEEHEGKLWFESEAGKGSIFYVELPVSLGKNNRIANDAGLTLFI